MNSPWFALFLWILLVGIVGEPDTEGTRAVKGLFVLSSLALAILMAAGKL
jgi:hypothetical protein